MYKSLANRDPRGRQRGGVTFACSAAVTAALLLAAGCSSGSPAPGGSSGSGGSGGDSSGGGTKVTATETEFHIALSKHTFSPGKYTFVAVDKGTASHSLVISGPGVSDAKTPGLLSPGQSASVTVTLKKGTYDIFCGVPGHKALGMDVHITVS